MSALIYRQVELYERRHSCLLCHLPAKLRCSRCRQVWFCSKACQRAVWKTHKRVCGVEPVASGGAESARGACLDSTSTAAPASARGDVQAPAAAPAVVTKEVEQKPPARCKTKQEWIDAERVSIAALNQLSGLD